MADVSPDGTADLDDDDDDDDSDDLAIGSTLDGDGAFYGLRAGYDRQFGPGLVGGLLQYDRFDVELGESGIEADSVFRAGLRGGLTAGRNLFYVTGGYATVDTDDIGSSDGYFAGAGYEAFVTPNVSLGLEALYHDFDSFDDLDDDIDADATTVGVNLNFRF